MDTNAAHKETEYVAPTTPDELPSTPLAEPYRCAKCGVTIATVEDQKLHRVVNLRGPNGCRKMAIGGAFAQRRRVRKETAKMRNSARQTIAAKRRRGEKLTEAEVAFVTRG